LKNAQKKVLTKNLLSVDKRQLLYQCMATLELVTMN